MDTIADIITGVLFGAVQGLAEFFPISSSGHLVIFEKCAEHFGRGVNESSLAFSIALHAASLAAIVWVMREDLRRIFLNQPRLLLLLLVATVPAGLIGLLFTSYLEQAFASYTAVGGALIVTGLMLVVIELKKPGDRRVSQVGLPDAIIIGIGQAFALVPGLSRSGCTISAGLFRRMSRNEAVRFSFLMAIPAIGGACGLEVMKLFNGTSAWAGISAPLFLSGTISSFVFSLLALLGLLKLVRRHKLSWFALWCIPVGIVLLAL